MFLPDAVSANWARHIPAAALWNAPTPAGGCLMAGWLQPALWRQRLRMIPGAQVVPHPVSDSTTHCVTAAARPCGGLRLAAPPPATYLDHLGLQLQQGMLVLQDVAVPLGHRPHVPHKGLCLPLQLLCPRLDDAAHIHALQGENRGGLLPGVADRCAGQGTATSGSQPVLEGW